MRGAVIPISVYQGFSWHLHFKTWHTVPTLLRVYKRSLGTDRTIFFIMEEIKKCPYCGGDILADAKKCKHCGEWVNEESRIEYLNSTKQPSFFNYYLWEPIFKHYFDFKGKMPMKQYWISNLLIIPLFILAFTFLLALLVGLEYMNSLFAEILDTLFTLYIFIPSIACAVRRLRDTKKNPWWVLIGVVPIIGWIWLIVLLCKEGECISKNSQFRFSDLLILIVMLFCIIAPFWVLV